MNPQVRRRTTNFEAVQAPDARGRLMDRMLPAMLLPLRRGSLVATHDRASSTALRYA
jgi:hypothetical protein